MATKKKKKLEDITKKYGTEREKALKDALDLIEKDLGKGSLMRLGEAASQKVQVTSSGSLALDIALGAGGYLKVVSSRFMVRKVLVRQQLRCMRLLKCKPKVVLLPLSMQSMLWTPSMQQRSA